MIYNFKASGKTLIPAAVMLLMAGILLFSLYGGPSITWKKNTGQMYMLEMESKVSMYYEGNAASIESDLNAVLNFKVAGVSDDCVSTVMQLSDISFTRGGLRNKAYEHVLSAPFQVRFSRNGEVLGYSFKGIARGDDKFFRGIVSSLACVMRKSFFGSWSGTEKDEYGTYIAAYSSDKGGAVIEKKKKRYTESEHNILTYTGKSDITIVKSRNRFDLSKETSWVKKMDSFELVRFHANKKKLMDSAKTVGLSLTDFNPDNTLAIWSPDFAGKYKNPEDDWTDECAGCRDREYSYEYLLEREAMKEFVKNDSIGDVLGKIIRTDGNDPGMTKKLKILLTLYPEYVKKIYGNTVNGKYTTGALSSIMQAMAEAGNNDAQDYLRNIAVEPEVGKTINLMSTVNLGFLNNPSYETINTLKELYGMRDGEMNAIISNSSILSLGRLASGMKTQGYNTDARKEIEEFIVQELRSNNKDPNIAASCVAALGSAGDKEYFDTVKSHLTHESGFVRAAAVTAMTNFKDDSVPEILRDHFSSEKDESARKKVIEGLASYPPDRDSIKLVKKSLPEEKSQSVRNVMLRYLAGSQGHDPKVRETLEKALSNETSATNRDIIIKGLYMKKQDGNN